MVTKLVFTLDADDLRRRDEITTNGVIDGKLARGDYEVVTDEDDPVRFLLDGLGVLDLRELKLLVDTGRSVAYQGAPSEEEVEGAAV